jgi:DNA (cytosine-5)-methyltransferase 1
VLSVHGTQDPDVRVEHAHTLGRNNGQENAVAYSVDLRGREGGATAELGDNIAGTLGANHGNIKAEHAWTGQLVPTNGKTMAVRRLTPTECERLQGFPDDYTQVPFRNKPAADGPRYKALGNSMAVPCMNWIGMRIANQLATKGLNA